MDQAASHSGAGNGQPQGLDMFNVGAALRVGSLVSLGFLLPAQFLAQQYRVTGNPKGAIETEQAIAKATAAERGNIEMDRRLRGYRGGG